MVVSTGVVLSVKLPKVPMPATAAAVPMMAIEPTTLRAVALSAIERVVVVLMACVSLCWCVTGDPATGRTLRAQPQATRERSARDPQGSGGGRCRSGPRSGSGEGERLQLDDAGVRHDAAAGVGRDRPADRGDLRVAQLAAGARQGVRGRDHG